MSIEKAIELLRIEYQKALKCGYVRNPVAYALYKVWRQADSTPVKKARKATPNQ